MYRGFSTLMRTSVSTFKLTHGDLHPRVLDRDAVRWVRSLGCVSWHSRNYVTVRVEVQNLEVSLSPANAWSHLHMNLLYVNLLYCLWIYWLLGLGIVQFVFAWILLQNGRLPSSTPSSIQLLAYVSRSGGWGNLCNGFVSSPDLLPDERLHHVPW